MRPVPCLNPNEQIGYWYWGSTGSGKSKAAREDFPGAYLKMASNKWWDGYMDQENVLLDDFDKAHHYMDYHLKIWVDLYSFIAEDKGGAMTIRPRRIVVTSNYHPCEIWSSNPNSLEPIIRRFHIVQFRKFGELTSHVSDEVRAAFESNVTDHNNARLAKIMGNTASCTSSFAPGFQIPNPAEDLPELPDSQLFKLFADVSQNDLS